MLERVSPLPEKYALEGSDFHIREVSDFVLTQVAGDTKALKKAFPKAPAAIGDAVERDQRLLLRIGPTQLWVIGSPPEVGDSLFLTPLSSSRTLLVIEGSRAREVLSGCAAIDFHPKVFGIGQFAMTGIHHMPVLIHCIGEDAFHLYVMRTFALTMWEILVDATPP
jgi:methylglutamate dehydrogenase subunit D